MRSSLSKALSDIPKLSEFEADLRTFTSTLQTHPHSYQAYDDLAFELLNQSHLDESNQILTEAISLHL